MDNPLVKSTSPAFTNQGRFSDLQFLQAAHSLHNKMFAWIVFQKLRVNCCLVGTELVKTGWDHRLLQLGMHI